MATNPVSTSTQSTPVVGHSGKEIGTTTIGASGAAGFGAGVGYALGKILLFILFQLGVDASPIEDAVIIVCTAICSGVSGIIGGKYSPTNKANETLVKETVTVSVPAPVGPVVGPVTSTAVPVFTDQGNQSATPLEPSQGSTAKHRAEPTS